jgi:inner membrane protein
MDNLTHSLVGLVAAKAGLERLSPGATALCILAANAPDADVFVGFLGDRWTVLQHHRGITHSLFGTACLAIIIPLIFALADFLFSRIRGRPRAVNLKGLLVAGIIVSATHPLMDWTNNYGVRLLLPWSEHWSYGDLVFIVDPFIWLVLGGTAFLLTSSTRVQKLWWIALGTVTTLLVVLGPRSSGLGNLVRAIWIATIILFVTLSISGVGKRFDSHLALASLVLLVLYWGGLWIIHDQILTRAQTEAHSIIRGNEESVVRLAAMPTLADPFRWDCVFETNLATYRFRLNLFEVGSAGRIIRYQKPNGMLSEAISTVNHDRRLKIFLGFARFPVAQLENQNCTTQTLVQFADLRYTEPGSSRGNFALELPVECPNETAKR